MKITIRQVLELNKLANLGTTDKLKKWFPEAFKVELEVGKVYKGDGYLFCFDGNFDYEKYPIGYGFTKYGDYSYSKDSGWGYKAIKEATIEEWESALIEEAKRRGYKNGNYECLSHFGSDIVETDSYFVDNDGYLFQGQDMGDANLIFKDGAWAEIIKTISKEEAEKQLGVKIIL